MSEVMPHILYGICFMIAAFVVLWCIGMFANWAQNGFLNRFTVPEDKEHENGKSELSSNQSQAVGNPEDRAIP